MINDLIHHEYNRLAKIRQPEQERLLDDFLKAWSFALPLLELPDDQVLIAAARTSSGTVFQTPSSYSFRLRR